MINNQPVSVVHRIQRSVSSDCEEDCLGVRWTKVKEQMERHGIDWQDILYVLAACDSATADYSANSKGAYVVTGETVDGDMIAVVVVLHERSSRVTVINVWKL